MKIIGKACCTHVHFYPLVTKVVNEWGPQTRGIDPGSKPIDAASKEEEKGTVLLNLME